MGAYYRLNLQSGPKVLMVGKSMIGSSKIWLATAKKNQIKKLLRKTFRRNLLLKSLAVLM